MLAANASRELNIVGDKKKKSIEKLSSGYRINRAADDAAGLSISEKLRWQKRGLNKASVNARDGISFIQTAEGALSETHSMLDRMKELMTQAANDTNTPEDRKQIQTEVDQLTEELDRVSSTTKYNTLDCFSKDGLKPDSITSSALSLNDLTRNADGTYSGLVGNIEVTYSFIDGSTGKIAEVQPSPRSKETGAKNSFNAAETTMANDVVTASSFAVGKLQSNFQQLFANGSSPGVKVGLRLGNIDGSNNTLARADLSMHTEDDPIGTHTEMTLKMEVDTSDYNPATYTSNNDSAYKLYSTIAHEMTHLVMYDTLTDAMLDGASKFPKWFTEGMAQTSSGDGGWFSYSLDSNSTDDAIRNYMSQIDSMPYGAGYLACMYLGYAAASKSASATLPVTSDNIKSGLNDVLGELSDSKSNKSFDDVIKDTTNYNSVADFVKGVRNADPNALQFTKDFIKARGKDGAGSLFGELSENVSKVFGNISNIGTNYTIEKETTDYLNYFNGTMRKIPPSASQTAEGNPKGLILQVGALSGQTIKLLRFDVSADALLGGETLDTTDNKTCGHGMSLVEDAIERTSKVRSYYGAVQNRLEHTVANVDNIAENTDAAESRIRDTDMAKEMVYFSMQTILEQAGQSMLAQTNQITQGVLSLLRQ